MSSGGLLGGPEGFNPVGDGSTSPNIRLNFPSHDAFSPVPTTVDQAAISKRRLAGIKPSISGFEPSIEHQQGEISKFLPDHFPPIYQDFFHAMLEGKHLQPTDEQIKRAVENHFSVPPLTQLSAVQKKELREQMIFTYAFQCSYKPWKALAGDTFYIPNDADMNGNTFIGFLNESPDLQSGIYAKELEGAIGPLTPSEKEALLTNPHVYTFGRIKTIDNGHITLSELNIGGKRRLVNEPTETHDSYGYSTNEFTHLLQHVRQSQGKSETDVLRGLDLGGKNGLAAHDAETIDPYLHMTNLTIHPDIAVWPLRGKHILQQAEWLPQDMVEQFDVIISNMAFRNMLYPDIALANAVKSLAVGGIMSVHFSSDLSPLRTPERINELFTNMMKQFQQLEQLQKEGIIAFQPMFGSNFTDLRDYWIQGVLSRGGGHICLQKTGHII